MKSINVGLMGLGTVGTGVWNLIEERQSQLAAIAGCEVKVTKVLIKSREKQRQVAVDNALLTTDIDVLVNDPEIDILIEVMGGIDDTYGSIQKALQNRKHVISANKDLMAVHGGSLQETAAAYDCNLYYEAAVGGGIPVLRSLTNGLSLESIHRIIGILNGTSNFILSKMAAEHVPFDEVLKEAQDLGFAEADPYADISGLDAARKMVILAHLGCGVDVNLDDVQISNIESIDESDIDFAERMGYVIKQIGTVECGDHGIEIGVEPTFLPKDHSLASVNGEYNAVYVYGDAVGETMFYGPGAGERPTASSIMADLAEVIKNMKSGLNGSQLALKRRQEKNILNPGEGASKFYLRLHLQDEIGSFMELTHLFKEQNISLEKVIQEPLEDQSAEVAVITHQTSKQAIEDMEIYLKDLNVVQDVKSQYRVEGMMSS
ncbi:homoserine dehydrogenase [Tuberibacillus sp. Marseille-P3662]|uniref:homoserine dehydrogenase n=1 Tax=Tuberibacillus sp. Marseille-P3662 TaxID=1965358 RepID=UPI000A1C9B61|nr:homoserine dehydrogenase [Tuberibacillus sp. Marseille-P3662]